MRYLLLLTFLVFSGGLCLSQEKINIVYNQDLTVTVNNVSINNSTTYKELVELLGEPEVYKEYLTGKIAYRYSDMGLVFSTVDGKLLSIGFNFNWDGDKNFPNSTYTGTLTIGEEKVDPKTTAEIIAKLKSFEINCILPGMCMNDPKKFKNPILLGFKDDLITQVSIEFH